MISMLYQSYYTAKPEKKKVFSGKIHKTVRILPIHLPAACEIIKKLENFGFPSFHFGRFMV